MSSLVLGAGVPIYTIRPWYAIMDKTPKDKSEAFLVTSTSSLVKIDKVRRLI